jgi:hypothetical protein
MEYGISFQYHKNNSNIDYINLGESLNTHDLVGSAQVFDIRDGIGDGY